MKKILCRIIAVGLLCACHGATPPSLEDGHLPGNEQGGNGDNGNTGEDKPTYDNPEDDFATSFGDDTPRYVGTALTLSYADGGVMAVKRADDSYALIDLDSPARVELAYGEMNPADSLLSAVRLTVGGEDMPVVSARLARRTAKAEWIVIHDARGGAHLMVCDR